MEILDLKQGTRAWVEHRATALNASDAPVMLGVSPYSTRQELIHERATGIVNAEIDPATAKRFADGHRFESLARPLAEQIVGEELFPVVGKSGKYSASFDGLTLLEDTAFEHKTLGEALRYTPWDEGNGDHLPLHYRIQLEHQCMVCPSIERVLFMASKWDDGGNLIEERHCWYAPNPELRARIIAGWEQFEADVAAYVPTEAAAPVVPAPMESLPAVVVQVQGALTVAGNLPAFGQALRSFIERIPLKPATDQQFADAEAACKALKKAEDALTQAEDGALAQISDVEQMRRAVADLKELARSTRLATEKLVKAEKDARRTEKVMAARSEFDKHVARLQLDIKGVRLMVPAPDFGGAIKGMSSIASMDDKLTAALIEGKANANTVAGRVMNNLQSLDSVPRYAHLFADRQELAYKDAEVLELLMQKRVDAEQARIEAERQRIRSEEQAKAQAEAQAAREAQAQQAIQQAAAPAAAPAAQRAQLDADPRFAAVVAGAPAAPAPAPWDADEAATLKLGDVNARLTPIQVSADGLRELGIEPAGRERRAVLYRESQFAEICGAIARRAADAMREALEAVA